MLAVLLLTGCPRQQRTDWTNLYSEAREKADRHESAPALQLVEQGLQGTSQNNPLLNYQFHILKAELIAWQNPKQALQLADMPPPPELSGGEFDVRRKAVQGLAHAYQGDFKNAELYLQDARRQAEAGRLAVVAKVASFQGYIAAVQKQDAKAEIFYRQTIAFARQFKQPLPEIDASVNLSNIEINQERYGEAVDTLSPVVEQARLLHAPVSEQAALGNLGRSYFELGDSAQSISLLTQAQALAGAVNKSHDQQIWSVDLGDVYLNQEDYGKSEYYFSAAVALADTAKDNRQTGIALHNLAQLELRRDNVSKAEQYNQQALELLASVPDPYPHTLCMLTTAEIAIRREEFLKAEQLLETLAASKGDSSLVWRARSDLANLYLRENKISQADQEFSAAIETVESARAIVKQEEHRMSILDAWPFYDDYIRFLINHKKERKALEKAEFSRSRTLAEGLGITGSHQPGEISIKKVQNLLKEQNKTILAYWLADQESYLWVVSATQIKSFRLPPRKDIEQLIADYSAKLLQHRGIDDSDSGRKLYDILVRPARALIPKGSSVIIIPHRSLYKLNFETLVVATPKPHYWIDDATIEVAGSVALLTAFGQRRSATARKLLLMGAPVQAPTTEFGMLIHAGEEIDKVKNHFSPIQEEIITGKDATPAAYASAQAQLFEFIHFVTHGKASDTSPLDSAIILSPQADNSFKLYARYIVKTHLNASVVTISACESAGTKTYSGEGLVGLAWAFLRAGAHRVVAGLWEVDDRATPDLMDNFYAGMKHHRASEALRQAKLKMVHSKGVYRFPYYWASLELYMGS